jgi:AcrR family transcriptional regulator
MAMSPPLAVGDDREREAVLDAAEELFYGRGIHSVGMDAVRDSSGVPLKRLYKRFAGKEDLVEAFLERRDVRWRGSLAAQVYAREDPEDRLLEIFAWLHAWFRTPGFRGCAWINSYGELGAVSDRVAALARDHKAAFSAFVEELVEGARLPGELARELTLLAEGSIVVASIGGEPDAALDARRAAKSLIATARAG